MKKVPENFAGLLFRYWLCGVAFLLLTNFLLFFLMLPIALLGWISENLLEVAGIPHLWNWIAGIVGGLLVFIYFPATFAWILSRGIEDKGSFFRSMFLWLLGLKEVGGKPEAQQAGSANSGSAAAPPE